MGRFYVLNRRIELFLGHDALRATGFIGSPLFGDGDPEFGHCNRFGDLTTFQFGQQLSGSHFGSGSDIDLNYTSGKPDADGGSFLCLNLGWKGGF